MKRFLCTIAMGSIAFGASCQSDEPSGLKVELVHDRAVVSQGSDLEAHFHCLDRTLTLQWGFVPGYGNVISGISIDGVAQSKTNVDAFNAEIGFEFGEFIGASLVGCSKDGRDFHVSGFKQHLTSNRSMISQYYIRVADDGLVIADSVDYYAASK